MDSTKVQAATVAVRSLFDGEIPEDFEYEGQTFEQRCEAWVLHAVDELSEELETFEDDRLEEDQTPPVCEPEGVPGNSQADISEEPVPSDETRPQDLDGNEKRSFRAQWCGHVEIEARTKEEALDIHTKMAAQEILDQLVFDGIKEN
jgi:hypothetical protein